MFGFFVVVDFCLFVGSLCTLAIWTKIEVVPFQNDVSLTTAFEGEDIPNFGVFTDHQVALTNDPFDPCLGLILICFLFFLAGGTGADLVEHQHLGP